MHISSRMLLRRRKLGLSQAELARRLKVSRQTISFWERKVFKPSEQHLEALNEFLSQKKRG